MEEAKSRKRRRHKSEAAKSSDALGALQLDDSPPVMWSPEGSGFEASRMSPAGQQQARWQATSAWNSLPEARQWRIARNFVLLTLAALCSVAVLLLLLAGVQAIFG